MAKLTAEQWDATLTDLEVWLEQGFCGRRMGSSVLGLEWGQFSFDKFEGHENVIAFMNPPEFVHFALPLLDGYATSLLASEITLETDSNLTFSCGLQRRVEQGLVLHFGVRMEQGRIDSESVTCWIMDCFKALAHSLEIGPFEDELRAQRARRIMAAYVSSPIETRDTEARKAGELADAESQGRRSLRLESFKDREEAQCVLQLTYPGSMVPEKSPYLNRRPVDLWPVATLTLSPSPSLRERARQVASFLQSSPETSSPN